MNLPHGRLYQVISDGTLWFGAASKVRLLDPFGGRKKTEDGLFPRKVFLEIFGEKREGRVFRIFQDFFHLYMTTLFLLGTFSVFSVASPGRGGNYTVSLSVPQHHLCFSVPWL